MSDSFLALLFAAGAAGRLAFGDALPPGDEAARWGLQGSRAVFQGEGVGGEAMVVRDLRPGALAPVVAASVTDDGAAWAGLGLRWRLGGPRLWAEGSLMPGLYAQGDGPDLGHALQFRSTLAVGTTFESGMSVALAVDHRSNANISSLNPGLETVGLRVSWPLP